MPWAAPRIHAELVKLGIDVGETSVGKYLVRHRRPPSQTWRTFLEITSRPWSRRTLYAAYDQLSGALRLSGAGSGMAPRRSLQRHRHRRMDCGSFPFDEVPRSPVRDRDSIFGSEFCRDVKAIGIKEVLRLPGRRGNARMLNASSARSPECLDHVIVFNQASLYRYVKSLLAYYHDTRTHLSPAKNSPESRPVQSSERGAVVAIQVGGLHHRYERRAA